MVVLCALARALRRALSMRALVACVHSLVQAAAASVLLVLVLLLVVVLLGWFFLF